MTRAPRSLSMLPLLLGLGAPAAPAAERFDVVVYGGNAAGVVAAVQARRMGRTVVLLEPGRHLGGLTSGGLGNTDIGNKGAIGGLSRRFYERVAAHYARPEAWVHETREEYEKRSAIDNQGHGRPDPVAARTGVPTMWVFEPRVTERILQTMAEEAGVPVRYGERLDLAVGVSKKARAIASIRMESGKVYEGRAFVDATYEGDLMA
jgi:flavin-dependent dehydrogenase